MALIDLLVRLYPRGLVAMEPGTTAYADLQVLGDGLDAAWGERDDLVVELHPDTATNAGELASWERVFGIRHVDGKTESERQDAVIAQMRFLPNANPSTYEAILEQHNGLDWDITEPGAFRCDDPNSLCDTATDLLDGVFIWFADTDSAAALAASLDRDEIQDLCDRMAQGHVNGWVRFTDAFRCDDPYSLCDRDLLGS